MPAGENRSRHHAPVTKMEELERLRERVKRSLDMPHYGPKGEYPPLNVWVGDDVVVTAELPGFESEEIDVAIMDNVVIITAQRALKQLPGYQSLRQERFHGKFTRSLEMPFNVDDANAQANLKHGVLQIKLNRRQEPVRNVKVTVRKGNQK
jgi:HSP20 family protein